VKTAYLDIETDYRGAFTDQRLFRDATNHHITILGIRLVDGPHDELIQLIGDQVVRDNLMQALAGVERLVTYNGRSIPDNVKRSVGFDFPVIAAQLGVVLDKLYPHTDLCPLCWQKGLYGGLKKVEATLGLKRKLPGRDGLWAQITWRKYEFFHDEKLLQELLAYNKEDVCMLKSVEEALARRK
jgi:uncharacterized protein